MSTDKSFRLNGENIFCISLHTAGERQKRIWQRFDHFDMDVSMWWAATPEDVVDKCADYLSPGQRACAQSHMNVWRHIVDNKLPYALVLEDDACFDKRWRYHLDEFLVSQYNPGGKAEPQSGAVFPRFDARISEANSESNVSWDMLLLNCSEPVEPAGVWIAVKDQYLTGAYLISLDGAQKLVDMFGAGLFAADWMTTRLQLRGRCYAFFPWLVIQEGLDTTIGSSVDADHTKVLKCLSDYDYGLDNYVI
jgi:GR25 family glycosyltransferase involved in LPS biosynthesis